MTNRANSPASAGPAGSLFEGQVGAHYLLTMLAGAEPRGLPGTTINRVELQRAGEGYRLDDVILHACDARGAAAVLEIQVKRSISFAATDSVFRKVVSQIAEASRKPDFDSIRYELAIATAKTSRKIDGAYQEVLSWARQLGDATTFFERLERPGAANDDMRTFVRTFTSNLSHAGAPHDNETVWKLLRRLQILVFDFTAQGSAAEELAKERAIRVLHPDEASRASDLWTSLIELSIRVAASGGDRDRSRLNNDLADQSFRFSGERRFASARAAISEASQLALADINDRVGEARLTRYERIAAINDALDRGRYVEIRGDAGVGKSAILKHFAAQISGEAKPIVFSPNRTTPRGWTVMRSEVGFDGTARELLTDYAASGGTIIFIDGLDFFSEQERVTIADLVREAALVPGVSVFATARRDFGTEDPNWLPLDSLSALGVAPPVTIGELTEDEIDELRSAAPSLAPLLSDTHPARDVARNLFRLARLALQRSADPLPRTEVEMAELWWRTADGRMDDGHRDRARVLRDLAAQSLSQIEPLDVSEHPATAINALVASETLRDMRADKVSFRHDVLREWAIACLIESDLSLLQRLPLQHTAPPALARAVELLSRATLERETDSSRWQSLLTGLSGDDIHGSWRRSVLLSLVRSEAAATLLTRASGLLLAEKAKLLREVIRLVMAIDIQPAAQALARAGMVTSMIPDSLNLPSGPSWLRLIIWLHSAEHELPAAAIPEVVELYTSWSLGAFGHDPLTPSLLKSFYRWLIEIEEAREAQTLRDLRQPFGGELEYEQIPVLESELRTGFLLFCHRTPDLAVQYLGELRERDRTRDAVRSILKFHGSLAQAAPAELAELTATALIPDENSDEDGYRREYREPFEYIDHEFLPASPAQGPFLELLTHSPGHGKALIHQLIEHAIDFYSGGRDHGEEVISIVLSKGERAFPWVRSYNWSREGAGHYSVCSGLMALEAWAHGRIETGEPFGQVLSDILGPPGSPAAYLLVAVDLILSHWPQSREAAIPYLACPELLCIDRERAVHDSFEFPDLFGLKALQREPAGAISSEGLKNRPSRRQMLDQILGNYAVFEPFEHRETLRGMLQTAAARIGPPNDTSNLGDPSFMAVHALNLIDPANYREVSIPTKDGSQTEGFEYVPPEAERQHLSMLQEAAERGGRDTDMQLQLSMVVDDPSRSSAEFAAAAIDWATKAADQVSDEESDDNSMREQAIVTAAMVAMRDGDTELRESCGDWVREVFADTLGADPDPVHRFRAGVRYNPCAIAFVGMVHALKQGVSGFEVHDILRTVSSGNPAAAHGFGATATNLFGMDERLLPAILRIAFTTCIRPHRRWDIADEEVDKLTAAKRARDDEAVNAELAWLANDRPEPDWPIVPLLVLHQRRGIRIPGGLATDEPPEPSQENPEEYFDHQAAALWLSKLRHIAGSGEHPWVQAISRTYSRWTAAANGAGLDAHEEVTNEPSEWNDAYFYLLTLSLRGVTLTEVDELALAPICSLPDEPFFDVVSTFVRSVDEAFFNDLGLDEPYAIHVRSRTADRLMRSSGWRRLGGSRKASIEVHIAPAIASLLFNEHVLSQPPRCYLLSIGIDRLDPFLETVSALAQDGPSLFVAMATLNLLEVSPRVTHLPFLISVAKSWFEAFSDFSEFWVNHGIGRRFCALIETALGQDRDALGKSNPTRADLDRILPGLVSLGVPEARRLEEALM